MFAKIFTYFFSKTEQQESETENNNDSSEYNVAETDIDAVVTDTDIESAGGVSQEEARLSPSERWFKAIVSNNLEEIQTLLDTVVVDSKNQHGWSGLHLGCWNGNLDVVKKLLLCGASANSDGPQGSTPLALAVQKGHTDICKLLLEDSNSDVNHSADLGENLNVTPLHLAVQNGHLEITQLLLKHQADVNAQMSVRGITAVTPLHLAVSGAEANHMAILDLLIKAGSNINQQT